MSNSVQMPALGESVTEGTVTRWLKSVGEEIEVDEPLLEVSTDKVDTEIPSPYAGVLEKILADEDDVVEVGGDLAYIGDGSGSDSAASSEEDDSDDEDSSEAAEAPEPAEAEETEAAEESSADSADEPAAEAPASSGSEGEGTEITMPALGESVTEGTVTRWLKEVGEEVEVDEPLLEVSTDKVDTEVPSPWQASCRHTSQKRTRQSRSASHWLASAPALLRPPTRDRQIPVRVKPSLPLMQRKSRPKNQLRSLLRKRLRPKTRSLSLQKRHRSRRLLPRPLRSLTRRSLLRSPKDLHRLLPLLTPSVRMPHM